jgi:hypothetical protein
MHRPPIYAVDALSEFVHRALARGCDVIVTAARDGQEFTLRVRNRQTIEVVEGSGHEVAEEAKAA